MCFVVCVIVVVVTRQEKQGQIYIKRGNTERVQNFGEQITVVV